MKEFTKRTISGFLFISIILTSIFLSKYSFFSLLLIILIFTLGEFYVLLEKQKLNPRKHTGIIVAALFFIFNTFIATGFLDHKLLLINILIPLIIGSITLFHKPQTFTTSFSSSLFGLIYILLPLSLFVFVSELPGKYNPQLVSGIFIIIWANDSFAYLSGVLLGRHKIFPSVSPKKTWEGFIGGMLLTIASSLVLSKFFSFLSIYEWMSLAFIIIATGSLGDFIESAIKRNAGVKDSGTFMPGHGGFFDRFDSLLFALPFSFIYLIFIL